MTRCAWLLGCLLAAVSCTQPLAEPPEPSDPCLEVKRSTRDDCYASAAIDVLDASLCGRMHDAKQRGSCHLELAQKTLNASGCSKLDEARTRKQCIDQIAKKTMQARDCEAHEAPEHRQSCRVSLAIDARNPEACAGVDDAGRRDECYDKAFDGDVATCNKIKDQRSRDICVANAGALHDKPHATCGALSEGLRDLCFQKAGLRDVRLCEQAGKYKDQCYRLATRDYVSDAECLAIPDPGNRDACLRRIADKHVTREPCSKMADPLAAGQCIQAVAVRLGDGSACLGLEPKLRKGCARALFPAEASPELCALLEGEERDRCSKRYAELQEELRKPK